MGKGRTIRVKELRGEIDQTDFAILLGVSPVTIWRWENGRAKPEGASLVLLELVRDYRREALKLLWKRAKSRLSQMSR